MLKAVKALFAPFGVALEEVLDEALGRFCAKWGLPAPKPAAVADKPAEPEPVAPKPKDKKERSS